MPRTERHVVPNPSGGWDIEAPGGSRASAHFNQQDQAISRARHILQNEGGGELVVHGRDGQVREKDTVAPGRDPVRPGTRRKEAVMTEKAPEMEAVLVHSATSRKRGGRRTGSSGSRRDRGPTRDELYAEARRLDIEGRSKMNKQELARAVGGARGRSGASSRKRANPVEVQAFLEGVGYPTKTRSLVNEARRQGASDEVRTTLGRLPEKEFDSPTEVSEAIGKL